LLESGDLRQRRHGFVVAVFLHPSFAPVVPHQGRDLALLDAVESLGLPCYFLRLQAMPKRQRRCAPS
jgi:hypothetical protein